MVAAIAGKDLGLFNASSNILGTAGVMGQAALGQFGGRAYVNATNGNLIMQVQDEHLAGRGMDLLQLRTYNSQGQLNDGDGDGWGWDGERTVVMTGTRNTNGSTVIRTAGDGSTTTYTWDGSRYSSHDGAGADDSFEFDNSSAKQWVFTDGSTRRVERYSDSTGPSMVGRLQSQKDISGNVITFSYDANNRLEFITDMGRNQSAGQKLKLTYAQVSGTTLIRLQKVETFALNVDAAGRATSAVGAAVRQVEYGYDTSGRLTSVTTDLTPLDTTDNGNANTLYKTKYTYVDPTGISKYIASVAQSNGTAEGFAYASFTYEAVPGSTMLMRVKTVTDASGTQTYTYGANSTDVKFSDDLAGNVNKRVWTYTYDAATKQLTRIESPAPTTGAARLVTQFHYDANGNVNEVTDARGFKTSNVYDARGNRTLERDAEGNTITRTYDSVTNQLLTETRYKVADSDGAGPAAASEPLTTRYVYDAQARLRFVISAEGRVSENRYGSATDGYGLLTRTLMYTGNRFDTGSLALTQAPSETDMANWLASSAAPVNKAQVQQTRYEYDLRGNMSKRTDFATGDAATGEGKLDAGATVTDFIYDGHGELLQTIARRGTNRDQATTLTSLTYDGLGRVIKTVSNGVEQTTVYDDVSRKIEFTTTASGLKTTSNYDTAGRLVSMNQSAGGVVRPQSQYKYDAQGRLQVSQDPLGARRFSFYDETGRLQFQVDSSGAVTGYEYDANGKIQKESRYGNRVAVSVMAGWVTTDASTTPPKILAVTKATFTVGTAAGADLAPNITLDRATTYEYDKAGRLTKQIDAANVQTQTSYDGLSRVIRQTTQQAAGDRVTQYFYDGDGRQVGVLDPLGYLTENKFDAGGRLVETVRYNTRSPGATNTGAPVWVGVTNQGATGGKPFEYHLPAAYDADGDSLVYSVLGTKPAWLEFDAASLTLRGTPPAALTAYDITLRASDGRTPPKTTDVTVHITVGNSAPSWSSPLADVEVASWKAGQPDFKLLLPAANDNESSASQLVYAINNALLPPGLSFDPATRTISGKPTTPGSYTITVKVTDPQGLSTQQSFVLQVDNRGLTWPPVVAPQALRNTPYSFAVPAALDPEGQALSYKLVLGPAWLSINPVTHILSGTPPLNSLSLGQQAVVLEAQDPSGETFRVSFSVNVVNLAPTWAASLSALWATAGLPVTYQLPVATDPEGRAVTYSAVGLPPELTLNASTGLISGTSKANDIRDFTLTVSVSDGEGGVQTRSLSVHLANSAPVYNPGTIASDVDVPAGSPQTLIIPPNAFTDPNGDVVTISIPGSIPGYMQGLTPGLYFEAPSGTLRYYDPTKSAGSTFIITVLATDARGLSSSRLITLHFKAVAPAPSPSPPPAPPGIPKFAGGGEEASQAVSAAAADTAPAPRPSEGAAAAVAAPAAAAVPVDALASLRPTASSADLHSYRYYDGLGRLVGAVDERGFLSETVYDAQANTQRSVSYLNSVSVSSADTLDALKGRADTGAGSKITNTTLFDGQGRVSTRTAADGTVTRNEYDNLGRMVREVRGDGLAEQRASRIRYNAFGEVTGTVGGEGDAAFSNTDDAIAQYGQRYEYDSLGRRIKATDASGNVSRFYYDSESRLTHTVNAKGEVSETVYNVFGQIQEQRAYGSRVHNTQQDPLLDQLKAGTKGLPELQAELASFAAPITTLYEYDKRGQVVKMTDGEGFVITRTYDAFGQLATQQSTIAKAAGATAAVTTTTQYGYDLRGGLLVQTADAGGLNFNQRKVYDAFGRATQSVDAAGKAITTNYTDGGRAIEVIDSLNRMVRTEYDAFARVLTQYDANGKATVYKYDDVARSVRITTPVSATQSISVLTRKTVFGETLSVTTGLSETDSVGQTMVYDYNKDGQLLKVTDALKHVVSANSYDKAGLLSETNQGGVVTSFSYDAANRMFERVVDATGLNEKTSYEFDAFGQQIKVTDSRGSNGLRTTTYQYDRKGQLAQVTVDPNGARMATRYTFDGMGNTIKVDRGTVSTPGLQVTMYVFDNLGRRVQEIEAPSAVFGAGSASARDLTTEYRYDAAGRVSRRIDAMGQSTWFVYDAAGELTHTINAEGEVTQNFYDANGRVVKTVNSGNRLASATVSGFGDVVSSITIAADQKDQRSYAVYDLAGRQRFTLQNTIGTNWIVIENRYDTRGNVIETRRYDKFLTEARITAIADGGISAEAVGAELSTLGYDETPAKLENVQRTRYAYDANNRLRFTVDALGSVSESVYDVGGRVVASIRYAVRPTLAACDEATIDTAVDRKNTGNQVSHFAFDAAGRLRFTVRVLESNASTGQATKQLVSQQTYDALGRAVQTTAYATALGVVSDYSSATLATKLTASAEDRSTAFIYNGAGQQIYSAQVLSVNGQGQKLHQVVKQVYDALGRVVQTTSYANALVLGNYNKGTLDAAVDAVASDAQNRTTQFVYDLAGRQRFVVAADGALSEMLYNALGQVAEMRQFDLVLTSATPITEAGLSARRGARVLGDGVTRGAKYTYDKAGRSRFVVAADGSFSETVYNALGQVSERRQFDIKVDTATPITEAGLGAWRGSRTVGDGTTRGEKYGYDKAGTLLSTTDAANLTETSTYDALGNRSSFTDRNGAKWDYAYDRLGRLSSQTAPAVLVMLSSNETDTPASLRLVTAMEYDTLGNLTKRTEASNTVDARETGYAYDRLGRQVLTTQPGWFEPGTGKVEKVQGSASLGRFQRTLETTYDALGNAVQTKVRTGAGSGPDNFINEYKTYDMRGHVLHDIDALGNVTAFSYTAFSEQWMVVRYGVSVGGTPPAGKALWSASDVVATIGNDPSARSSTTTYDTMGRKTSVSMTAVGSYFDFDPASGFGADVFASATTKYVYNAFGDIAVERLPNRNVQEIHHHYDAMGREIRTVDALGYQTARSYDALGNLIETREYANAGASTSGFELPGTPGDSNKDRITAFTYNALNQKISIQRKGLSYAELKDGTYQEKNNANDLATTVTSLTYDGTGHVLTQTDALNNVTTNVYNMLGQLIQVTEPARKTAATTGIDPFLAQNQVVASPLTVLTLNAFGQVVRAQRSAGGGAGATRTTRQGYDVAGNLVSITDANNNLKTRQLDYTGRVVKEIQLISVSSQNLELEQGVSQPYAGFSQKLERRYAYDALGRQTDVLDVYLDDAGVRQQSGKRSLYNAFGEVIDEQRVWGLASAGPGSLNTPVKVASYTYDNAGHLISKHAADGVTNYKYNLAGQVVWQEQRGGADSGTPSRNTFTQYDLLGREILRQQPFVFDAGLGGQEFFTASRLEQSFDRWGNVVSRSEGGVLFSSSFTDNVFVDNSERVTTTYEYNDDNQVVAEHLPTALAYGANSAASTLKLTHAIRYDVLGRAVQELDVADDLATSIDDATVLRTRSKEYNAAGQLIAEIDATQVRTDYVYDANGNRVGTRNGAGTVFVDQFDNNGNILSHSVLRKGNGGAYVSGVTAPVNAVVVTLNRHKYDQANRRVFSADITNDTTSGIAKYVTLTRYDERNIVNLSFQGYQNTNENFVRGTITTTATFDALGAKLSEKDANNKTRTWEYSYADYTIGQLKNTSLGGSSTFYTYNGFGQLVKEGIGRTYSYFGDGKLASVIDDANWIDAKLGDLLQRRLTISYSYNRRGQIAEESSTSTLTRFTSVNGHPPDQWSPSTTSTEFSRTARTSYDAQGRVTSVTAPGGSSPFNAVSYKYDALGNRRNIVGSYHNSTGSHTSNKWYDYDAEGRVKIVDGTTTGNGTVIAGSGGTTVTYDSAGRRASAAKFVGNRGITDSYIYDDLGYLTRTMEHDPTLGPEEFVKETRLYDTTGRLSKQESWQAFKEGDTGIFTGESVIQRFQKNFYDGMGNLYQQSITNAQGKAESDVTYSRDLVGNVMSYAVTQSDKDGAGLTLTTYDYKYDLTLSGYREKTIKSETSTVVGEPKILAKGSTENTYDGRGNLLLQNSDKVTVFAYDADRHIIWKQASDGSQSYFYAGGQQVAVVGTGSVIGTGSLEIAQFANSFTPISEAYPGGSPGSYVVNANDTLESIAQAVFGDSSLWYLIADANNVNFAPGDPLPTQEVGKTYHIPNMVANVRGSAGAFKPYNAAEIIGNSTPTPIPLPQPSHCSELGQVLAFVVTAVTIVASAYTGGLAASALGPILGGVVGGAAGSVAGQLTGLSLGVQDDFNFKQVLVAAGVGGVGAIGKLAATEAQGLSSTLGRVAGKVAASLWSGLTSMGIEALGSGSNQISFLNLLAGVGTDSLLSGAGDGLNGDNFKWGGGLEQLASGALNPSSGWAFNDSSRTWGNIVNQTFGAFTSVTVGGVMASAQARSRETQLGDGDLANQVVARAAAAAPDAISGVDLAAQPSAEPTSVLSAYAQDVLGQGFGLSHFNVHETLHDNTVYTVQAHENSETVGGHATGFRSDGEWLAKYNGKTGLSLREGDVLLVPKYIPALEAYRVQREEYAKEAPIVATRKSASQAATQAARAAQQVRTDSFIALNSELDAFYRSESDQEAANSFANLALKRNVGEWLEKEEAYIKAGMQQLAHAEHLADREMGDSFVYDILQRDAPQRYAEIRSERIQDILHPPKRSFISNVANGFVDSARGLIEQPFLMLHDIAVTAGAASAQAAEDLRQIYEGGPSHDVPLPDLLSAVGRQYEDTGETSIGRAALAPVPFVLPAYDLAKATLDGDWDSVQYQLGGLAFGALLGKAMLAPEQTPRTGFGARAEWPASRAPKAPVLSSAPAGSSVSSQASTYFPTTGGILRALYRSGTNHAFIIADAIKSDALKLTILATEPGTSNGSRGRYRDGTNEVTIFADQLISDIDTAGTVGHEGVHWLQDLDGQFANNGYHVGHEFEAFKAQQAIDPGHWSHEYSDVGLRRFLSEKHMYGNDAKRIPKRWTPTKY